MPSRFQQCGILKLPQTIGLHIVSVAMMTLIGKILLYRIVGFQVSIYLFGLHKTLLGPPPKSVAINLLQKISFLNKDTLKSRIIKILSLSWGQRELC